jgi:DNA-binding response OmpR family regulator
MDLFTNLLTFMSEETVGSRHRILLVDDDGGVRTLVETLLRRRGYSVTAVGFAKECLKKLRESVFDVILLDHVLPDMDGLLLLQLVRSKTGASQPIIYLTGSPDANTKEKAFEVGIDDYVTKPFKPVDLMTRIARQIELKGERDTGVTSR